MMFKAVVDMVFYKISIYKTMALVQLTLFHYTHSIHDRVGAWGPPVRCGSLRENLNILD